MGVPPEQDGPRLDGPHTDGPVDSERFIRKAFETDARLGCELLFRHYYKPLCNHAVRFVLSRAVAEDIVADVFCQFYANGTFAKITQFYGPFLYKTVRLRAYNYMRDETKRSTDLSAADGVASSDAQHPDAVTHYEDLYHDVERAIDTLPPQTRRVYLMHRFDGKTHADIATELKLSPRTVEVLVRRASHALRDLLRAKWSLVLLAVSSWLTA
ncbi:sigma-70 family RNA polymerase sigma factor [Fibrella aquatilis]|nr:sigma-70 family RNA polymerase sigma factor [Fibrella aquatilis]